MRKMISVIAVKGNSQRVPSKNIRSFADTTLLDLKISQVSQVKNIDEIIVSSEDERVWEIAKKHKISVHQRDPYYSQSTVPMSEVYSYIAKEVGQSGDDIIWTQVTSPMANAEVYQTAIEFYKKMDRTRYDSILSVNEIKDYLIYNNEPLNFKPNPWPRSQDLKGLYEINFAINILPRDKLVEWGSLYGEKPYFYPVSSEVAMDIDFPSDFEICEYFYKKNKELK